MNIKHKFNRKEDDYKMTPNRREYQRNFMRQYRKKIKDGFIPTPTYLKTKTKNPHYHAEYYRMIKNDVISHYSNNKNECNCCGEKIREFLSLDHIKGGGIEHRKKIKVNVYWWLKKNNYPEGFQILCHNCNQAKGYYGECPHIKMLTK